MCSLSSAHRPLPSTIPLRPSRRNPKSKPTSSLTPTPFPSPSSSSSSLRFASYPSSSAMDPSTTLKEGPLGSLEVDGNTERIAARKIVIKNSRGEKLIGILYKRESKDLVILCHGFRSTKESRTVSKLSDTLVKEGISVFRFDFSGNGESEGSFQYGNYLKEVCDLRSVIQYFFEQKYHIRAISGHSKGGNAVLLYASKYHDIAKVVNISGRFKMNRGIESRLGKDFLQRIKENGYIDVKNKSGDFDYRVTEESLMERLNTNMHDACLSIGEDCKVLTVHGSEDEIVPTDDAYEFSKLIPNHNLRIVEGADHRYSCHSEDLASAILEFLKNSEADCC